MIYSQADQVKRLEDKGGREDVHTEIGHQKAVT